MCIWWHRWSQWSDPVRESVDKVEVGVLRYKTVQMRTCKSCNKQEFNTLWEG